MGMPRLSSDTQRAFLKMPSSTSAYVLPTKAPVIPIEILSRNTLHGVDLNIKMTMSKKGRMTFDMMMMSSFTAYCGHFSVHRGTLALF